jgi:hypothetical protein
VSKRLALVRPAVLDVGGHALDALADALLPRLLARLGTEREAGELVEVAGIVPLPRRVVLRACRGGAIPGAVRVARRWLAPRSSVDAWLRSQGPRVVPTPRDDGEDDDLEETFASLARPSRPRSRRAG